MSKPNTIEIRIRYLFGRLYAHRGNHKVIVGEIIKAMNQRAARRRDDMLRIKGWSVVDGDLMPPSVDVWSNGTRDTRVERRHQS